MWSFGPPPPPHPQHNVNVDSSKEDLLLQHCFWGGGGGGETQKIERLQNDVSPAGIFSWSSGAKTFGQHCMYPKIKVFLGVRTCEVFVCSLAIVRVRVYYLDFFVFIFYVTGECHRFLHSLKMSRKSAFDL